MIDTLIYICFFWILVLEVVIFVILNLPTPKYFKGKIISFFSKNTLIQYVMYAHLAACLIAIFFFIDLTQQENFHHKQKQQLRGDVGRHIGTQLRLGFLSYTILKIQRNKYITFMLVYTSIALNIFIQLMKYIYKKREHLQSLGLLEKPTKKDSDKPQPHHIQTTTTSVTDKKIN